MLRIIIAFILCTFFAFGAAQAKEKKNLFYHMDREQIAYQLDHVMKLSWNLRDKCTSPDGSIKQDKKCEQFYREFMAEVSAMSEALYCENCR